jgi:hypothetical protein
MPKGEKIKAKAINGSLPLENFENSSFCLPKYSCLPLSVKSWSLVGRRLNYGKNGEFLNP